MRGSLVGFGDAKIEEAESENDEFEDDEDAEEVDPYHPQNFSCASLVKI